MRMLFTIIALVSSVAYARDMAERGAFIRDNPKPIPLHTTHTALIDRICSIPSTKSRMR